MNINAIYNELQSHVNSLFFYINTDTPFDYDQLANELTKKLEGRYTSADIFLAKEILKRTIKEFVLSGVLTSVGEGKYIFVCQK